MSFQSWCEEFYPVPADKVSESNALVHSLRKWIGLRNENLSRHDLRLGSRYLYDASSTDASFHNSLFLVADDSCALCVHHARRHWSCAQRRCSCSACPLYKVLGNKACDSSDGPYSLDFVGNSDVEPMIEALEAALRMVQSSSEGKSSGGEDANL